MFFKGNVAICMPGLVMGEVTCGYIEGRQVLPAVDQVVILRRAPIQGTFLRATCIPSEGLDLLMEEMTLQQLTQVRVAPNSGRLVLIKEAAH